MESFEIINRKEAEDYLTESQFNHLEQLIEDIKEGKELEQGHVAEYIVLSGEDKSAWAVKRLLTNGRLVPGEDICAACGAAVEREGGCVTCAERCGWSACKIS